jgi:hypothetical protein
MSRSLVRSFSVIALVVILTLVGAAAPVTAGQLGGGGFPHALLPGQCEFTQIPKTGHFFVAHGTGSDNHQSMNPGNQLSIGNVIVIGPLLSVPTDVLSSCTFIPTLPPPP